MDQFNSGDRGVGDYRSVVSTEGGKRKADQKGKGDRSALYQCVDVVREVQADLVSGVLVNVFQSRRFVGMKTFTFMGSSGNSALVFNRGSLS